MCVSSQVFSSFSPGGGGGSCEVCGDTVRKPWVWREVQILQKRLPTNYDDRTLNRQKFFPQTAESRATVWLNGTRKRTKSYEYKSTNTLSFSWWEFRPLPLQDVSCRQGQVPLARPEEFGVVAAIRADFTHLKTVGAGQLCCGEEQASGDVVGTETSCLSAQNFVSSLPLSRSDLHTPRKFRLAWLPRRAATA